MELKLNMYVRTKDGYIAKCTYIDKELENIYGFDDAVRKNFGDSFDFIYCKDQEEYITKASYNIAELLEVGDFLDNHCIVKIKDRTIFTNDDWFIDFDDVEDLVGTVATKEMFESISYKVGE